MEKFDNIKWIFSRWIEYNRIENYNESDIIYHYTSPMGLLGIVITDRIVLRFSKLDCLNDISEGKHVLEIYGNICKELHEENRINDCFYEEIIKIELDNREAFITKDQKDNVANGVFLDADKYICCFSKKRDLLPMWNYYSKAGKYEGYNIGINCESIMQMDKDIDDGQKHIFQLLQVIYSDKEKKEIIRKVIEDVYKPYNEGLIEIKTVKSLISQVLTNYSIIFKNSCFQHEEEVRAVLTIPKEREHSKYEIKYRTVNGYIVPYIDVNFVKESIREITIGPLLKDNVAENALNDFLKNSGYSDIQVYKSNIPVRY